MTITSQILIMPLSATLEIYISIAAVFFEMFQFRGQYAGHAPTIQPTRVLKKLFGENQFRKQLKSFLPCREGRIAKIMWHMPAVFFQEEMRLIWSLLLSLHLKRAGSLQIHPTVVIAIDTSGSLTTTPLNKFGSCF